MSNEVFEQYGTDPVALCKDWLAEAVKHEINDPEAINIATADAQGRPSNRMILIKEITERGFKFHTNEDGQKGREIAENPHASMCFYWKSIRKQIRITGTVAQVSDAESDEYFTTRPIERQIGAWASKQSSAFDSRAEMEASVKKYEDEFADANNIPRPPYWKGYRLLPETMEFWMAHKARLHTRFIYTKTDEGNWNATWLCP
jgi:pyridoxamine 5'-phosphate oxidase